MHSRLAWMIVLPCLLQLETGCGSGDAPGSAHSPGDCSSSRTVQLVGNEIRDTSGARLVARGPEIGIATPEQVSDVDDIASLGANAARFLLVLDAANGMTPEGFDAVLQRAVSHHLIVWLSLFTWDSDHGYAIGESLGGGNFYSLAAPEGTGTCSRATPAPCYLAVWSRPWLKSLVAKYQGHVIVDAMQEYIGVADASSEAGRIEWATSAKANIRWFRAAGYTQPLEIMSNFEGRDLYAIVQKGEEIRAVDTVTVSGTPQTLFGWQAYWASDWYKGWQGGLLLGGESTLTAAQAIHQFVVTRPFPIQVGLDSFPGDAGGEYQAEMDQAASDGASWLWWSWRSGEGTVDCPGQGATCQQYVTHSPSGFAGAVASSCGP